MRKEEIRELIKLVEESDIAELEVSEGRSKIRISRVGPSIQTVAAPASPAPASAPQGDTPSTPADATSAGDASLASNLKQITSPMVGTFYRSPAPGAEPFVSEGQSVSVGQTVCIVEAMKLMNEIGSDFGGVVQRVLVENGQPVEYGQPLFLVEIK
jgi:acetyl-CoA carboxylase biotin carboxyl carrier protein